MFMVEEVCHIFNILELDDINLGVKVPKEKHSTFISTVKEIMTWSLKDIHKPCCEQFSVLSFRQPIGETVVRNTWTETRFHRAWESVSTSWHLISDIAATVLITSNLSYATPASASFVKTLIHLVLLWFLNPIKTFHNTPFNYYPMFWVLWEQGVKFYTVHFMTKLWPKPFTLQRKTNPCALQPSLITQNLNQEMYWELLAQATYRPTLLTYLKN